MEMCAIALQGAGPPRASPGLGAQHNTGPYWAAPDFQKIYKFLWAIHALQPLASTRINLNTVVHAKFPTKQCQNGTLAITIWTLSEVKIFKCTYTKPIPSSRLGAWPKGPGPRNFFSPPLIGAGKVRPWHQW